MEKPSLKEFCRAIYKVDFRERFPLLKDLFASLATGTGCVKCIAKNREAAYKRTIRDHPEILSDYFGLNKKTDD